MKAIEFPEVTQRIAEHQPQFNTIPAYINQKTGLMVACYALEPHEVRAIVKNQKIWIHHILPMTGRVTPYNMVCVDDYFSSVIHEGGGFSVLEDEDERDLSIQQGLNSEVITTPLQDLDIVMMKKHKLALSHEDLTELINLVKKL